MILELYQVLSKARNKAPRNPDSSYLPDERSCNRLCRANQGVLKRGLFLPPHKQHAWSGGCGQSIQRVHLASFAHLGRLSHRRFMSTTIQVLPKTAHQVAPEFCNIVHQACMVKHVSFLPSGMEDKCFMKQT